MHPLSRPMMTRLEMVHKRARREKSFVFPDNKGFE